MNDLKTYTEYTVKKKSEKAFLLKKIFFLVGYTVIPLVLCLIIALTPLVKILFPLIPAILLAAASLAYYNSRFLDIEYEYNLNGETFTISRIYGKKSRKEWGVFDIRKAEVFAPYNREGFERYKNTADNCDADNIYDAVSSMSDENVFFMILQDEDANSKSLIFFEPNEKFLQTAKLYCRAAMAKELLIN